MCFSRFYFILVYKDINKLTYIMISLNFKENYVTVQVNACIEFIEKYKSYVQRKGN